MVRPATVRQWQRYLEWPLLLAALWLVLYTNYMMFGFAFGDPGESTLRFLFSSKHLSRPRGWFFLLSLIVTTIGGLFHTYVLAARY